MPIEPLQPKQLGDYWNPMQMAGLAAQAQSLGIQAKRLQLQEANQQFDNALADKTQKDASELKVLTEAYTVAPPLGKYAVANQIAVKAGLPRFFDPQDFVEGGPAEESFKGFVQALQGGSMEEQRRTLWNVTKLMPDVAKMVLDKQPNIEASFTRSRSEVAAQDLAPLPPLASDASPAERTAYEQKKKDWGILLAENKSAATEVIRDRYKESLKQEQLTAVEKNRVQASANIQSFITYQGQSAPLHTPIAPYLGVLDKWSSSIPTLKNGVALDLPLGKDVMTAFSKIKSLQPQVEAFRDRVYANDTMIQGLEDNLRSGKDALIPNPTNPEQPVKRLNMAEVQAMKLTNSLAKQETDALVSWIENPKDRGAYQAYRQAHASVETMKRTEQQRLEMTASDRLSLMRSEDQHKDRREQAQMYLEQQFMKNLNLKLKPNMAAELAADATNKTFPNIGVDVTKLKDPEHTGEVKVTIASPGERKELSEGRAALLGMADLETLYSDKFVGKIDNLLAKFKGPLDMLSTDEAEFRAAVKKQAATLRKFYAGTAQSKQELVTLLDSIPDTDQSETNFKAAMKATKKNIQRLNQEIVAVGTEVGTTMPRATPSLTTEQKRRYDTLKRLNPNDPEDIIRGMVEQAR